jgi:hypothetical protein
MSELYIMYILLYFLPKHVIYGSFVSTNSAHSSSHRSKVQKTSSSLE